MGGIKTFECALVNRLFPKEDQWCINKHNEESDYPRIITSKTINEFQGKCQKSILLRLGENLATCSNGIPICEIP